MFLIQFSNIMSLSYTDYAFGHHTCFT